MEPETAGSSSKSKKAPIEFRDLPLEIREHIVAAMIDNFDKHTGPDQLYDCALRFHTTRSHYKILKQELDSFIRVDKSVEEALLHPLQRYAAKLPVNASHPRAGWSATKVGYLQKREQNDGAFHGVYGYFMAGTEHKKQLRFDLIGGNGIKSCMRMCARLVERYFDKVEALQGDIDLEELEKKEQASDKRNRKR